MSAFSPTPGDEHAESSFIRAAIAYASGAEAAPAAATALKRASVA